MTRFFIDLNDAVKFVLRSFDIMDKGEIFIPKMPSIYQRLNENNLSYVKLKL